MSNITAIKPSFVFGYWRPWKEDSQIFDSYLDYVKDVSLVKYGADTVGKYIKQASKEQIKAIEQVGREIGRGMNIISDQLSEINTSLSFINRNVDILIEQQKLSNLLLENIMELLRVPDIEKERQQSIERGVGFFVNAKMNSDLYSDALEWLLKAESLMKQDYFVLHRIGCIYLYVEKYINPVKAVDYFARAAKYASVQSSDDAVHLANALTDNFNTVNSEINNSKTQIELLAADSYEKAAFSSYILGKFQDAVNYQSKAYNYKPSAENQFLLSKYLIRYGNISEAIINLGSCINQKPNLAIAVFKEIDLFNSPEVIKLIKNKNDDIDNKIGKLIDKWKDLDTYESSKVIRQLNELSKQSYEVKVAEYSKYKKEGDNISRNISSLESEIDQLIYQIKNFTFLTFDEKKIIEITRKLEAAKDLPIEAMKAVYGTCKYEIDNDRLKVGIKYAGGLVFYLDKTGKHGLVCSVEDLGEAPWGGDGRLETKDELGSGKENTKNIVDNVSYYIKEMDKPPTNIGHLFWYFISFCAILAQTQGAFLFGVILLLIFGFPKRLVYYTRRLLIFIFGETKHNALTAARICQNSKLNGYSDWYLPSLIELQMAKGELQGRFSRYNKYWTSTECGENQAYFTGDSIWGDNSQYRKELLHVCAIREF